MDIFLTGGTGCIGSKTGDDDVILNTVRVQLRGIEDDLRGQKLEEEYRCKDGLYESSQRQLINSIKNYVRSNLNGNLSLTVISDQVFYNTSYISRMFKRIEGINFSEFVMLERLNKACDLLACDSGTINQISLAVGFESPQYFATVFKKHTECTPNQYKVNMRKCRQIKQK